MDEVWKKIDGFDNYEVSNKGNVRSIKRNKSLKPYKDSSGYYEVKLYSEENGYKQLSVHRLVYKTFVGEIPEGMQVNHINEIKTDNSVENLNLMCCKDNVNWGTGNKRRSDTLKNNPKESTPILQCDMEGNVIREWVSQNEIQRVMNYSQGTISACCNNKKWKKSAYGYKWKFAN